MELTTGLLLLAGLAVFFTTVLALGRNELVKRRLVCPRTGEEAKVDVVRRYEASDPVRVHTCDLLPNPKKVDCDQRCLGQCT